MRIELKENKDFYYKNNKINLFVPPPKGSQIILAPTKPLSSSICVCLELNLIQYIIWIFKMLAYYLDGSNLL